MFLIIHLVCHVLPLSLCVLGDTPTANCQPSPSWPCFHLFSRPRPRRLAHNTTHTYTLSHHLAENTCQAPAHTAHIQLDRQRIHCINGIHNNYYCQTADAVRSAHTYTEYYQYQNRRCTSRIHYMHGIIPSKSPLPSACTAHTPLTINSSSCLLQPCCPRLWGRTTNTHTHYAHPRTSRAFQQTVSPYHNNTILTVALYSPPSFIQCEDPTLRNAQSPTIYNQPSMPGFQPCHQDDAPSAKLLYITLAAAQYEKLYQKKTNFLDTPCNDSNSCEVAPPTPPVVYFTTNQTTTKNNSAQINTKHGKRRKIPRQTALRITLQRKHQNTQTRRLTLQHEVYSSSRREAVLHAARNKLYTKDYYCVLVSHVPPRDPAHARNDNDHTHSST